MDCDLLKNIKSPADVKALSTDSLERLADEIRYTLIKTVGKNGGHLASNLGTVELTIALHRCFDSPNDKIIFDVGHQCYTHKLLTGRYDRFSTLRQKDGIAGFPRISESEHDIFSTGHSSTSIAEAYGLSMAEKLSNGSNYTVAVIGDGSFTGGLAYEGLNNAGRTTGNKLIIILNDNEMSISKNVGAVTHYLSVIRSTRGYFRFKARTERALNCIPLIGKRLSNTFYKIKTHIKSVLYNSNMFEDLGLRYMGPIDGHNIDKLCEVLEAAKEIDRTVLLHVHTVKGKGYDFAEKDPSLFHGISGIDPETGEPPSSGEDYSDAFGAELCELAEKDDRICAITAAMSLGTGLTRFSELYPNRLFDVGIAEEHAVVFASGLAAGGMIPVFVVYSTFLQRCYDQLIHDAALQKRKVIIAVDRAGLVGADGETHQGIFDVAFMNTISNFTIYSPSNYEELRLDMHRAVYEDDRVVAIRYPRGKEQPLPEGFRVTGNTFDIYGDPEANVSVITYGRLFANACSAYNELRAEGISVKLVKLNRIKPLPCDLIEKLISDDKIFFFEEGIQNGGVAEKLALRLLEAGYKGSYKLTAIDYCFVEQETVDEQLQRYGLDPDSMAQTVRKAFYADSKET